MEKRLGVALLAVLVAVSLVAQGAAAQTTYSLTVATAKTSYGPGDAIVITGQVSPAPGPSTAVFVRILNPSGVTVGVGNAPVGASTGTYNLTVVAGGTSAWVAGQYTVNATWGAYQPQLFAASSFAYSPSTTTTTSSTSSSTSTSTTSFSDTTTSTTSTSSSSTTSSTTTTSSTSSSSPPPSSTTSTTSSTKSGGIPEFPFQGSVVVLVSAFVVLAYALARKRARTPFMTRVNRSRRD